MQERVSLSRSMSIDIFVALWMAAVSALFHKAG